MGAPNTQRIFSLNKIHPFARRLLNTIFNRVYGYNGRKPKIFTSKFLHYHHNVQRPGCDFPSLLDYLDISNSVVFNYLVDQRSIVSTVICRTQDEAKTITAHLDDVPKNVNRVITQDFYSFLPI